MSLIGYARVSTEDQSTDAQINVLKVAGCAEIFREHMSGAKASRPELAKVLARVRRGDVLVVVRLDRLARSLSHPLSVIAELDAKGAHFESLADSIDTTTPRSCFASQVLGAVSGTRARADTGAHQGRTAPRQKTRPRRRQSQTARRRSRRHQANCRRESPSLFRARQPDRRTLAADRQRNAPRSTRWQDVVRVLNAKRDGSNGPPQPLWSVERLKRQGSELKLTAVNELANA